MDLPDPTSLRCFEAAARHLGFRAAAAEVGMSPAAFSDRIQRLEALLGQPVFQRSTRQVRLTAAGEHLLPLARGALAAAEACMELARDGAPAPVTLTLGTRFELGMSWVLPTLTELEAREPHHRIHLRFAEGGALMDGLRQGRLDAVVGSMRLNATDLFAAPLHEESYALVGSAGLVADRPLRRPEDARDHVLIDIDASLPLFRYWVDQAPQPQSWRFGEHRWLGTIAAIRARVLQGGGVAVLPAYFVAGDLSTGRLVRLQAEVACRTDWFRLIWRAGHPRETALEHVSEVLRASPLR